MAVAVALGCAPARRLISKHLLNSSLHLQRKTVTSMPTKLKPVVLSGPSGCGKSTIIKKLMEEYPNKFGFSVSHTTRAPRPGEVNGKDYYYTTFESMTEQIEKGEFLEHAVFNTNKYGTSKKAVQEVLDSGKVCIMDIDSQGVKNIKAINFDCVLIFVKPPTIEELERRLRGRGTETEESIQRRLSTSKVEFEYAAVPGIYHHTIVNDNLQTAYEHLKNIISSEVMPL